VNIARDLVFDSESWGRVYLPTDYMEDKENDLRILRQEKNPRALGNDKLNRYADKMNELCEKHLKESIDIIKRMPIEIRGLLLTSIEIYRAIYYCTIKSSKIFPNKAKLTRSDRCKILFRVLYVDSLQYLV